jgi:hypothetical protein
LPLCPLAAVVPLSCVGWDAKREARDESKESSSPGEGRRVGRMGQFRRTAQRHDSCGHSCSCHCFPPSLSFLSMFPVVVSYFLLSFLSFLCVLIHSPSTGPQSQVQRRIEGISLKSPEARNRNRKQVCVSGHEHEHEHEHDHTPRRPRPRPRPRPHPPPRP